jgi:hypothetical protein
MLAYPIELGPMELQTMGEIMFCAILQYTHKTHICAVKICEKVYNTTGKQYSKIQFPDKSAFFCASPFLYDCYILIVMLSGIWEPASVTFLVTAAWILVDSP